MENFEKLIEVLLDPTISAAERDDAAMDLSDFNDTLVINALFKIAVDSSVDTTVRASCGESLAIIWLNKGNIDLDKLSKLEGEAWGEAIELIQKERNDWIKELSFKYPEVIEKLATLR